MHTDCLLQDMVPSVLSTFTKSESKVAVNNELSIGDIYWEKTEGIPSGQRLE